MLTFDLIDVEETPYLYEERICSMDPAEIGAAMGEAFHSVMRFLDAKGIPAGEVLSVYYTFDPDKMTFRAGFSVSPEDAAKAEGAKYADYTLLRLPLEIRDLFVEWLEGHYPDRSRHVMTLVRDTRNGADYDSNWGQRRTGTGVYAELLNKRFRLARRKLGMDRRPAELDISKFKPPPAIGDQLTLI